MSIKQKIGIVGFGALGQYLSRALLEDDLLRNRCELVFVWNRSKEKILESTTPSIPAHLILEDLSDFASRQADLIVEVCHPEITQQWASKFLQHSDVMVGSPTAFASVSFHDGVKEAVKQHGRSVYVPSGALWGAEDIQKMGQRGTIGRCSVTMKKHPSSLKVESPLNEKLDSYAKDPEAKGEFIVFEGSVRDLCPLAPNNVNTMACAAIGASNLGFDVVRAVLIADKSLQAHVIDIEVEGKSNPGTPKEDIFHVMTRRYNPAKPGAVTGSATFVSFLSSLAQAHSRSSGIHLC
ncbi:hypothetical protein PROFUN_07901 [Planoprotostelium fungivorum]|uniref:Aspartate dehydrogenase domain-containing protein n=1 Tax=Planoprotostelium fungivorum TaxID=1890364 RepID=A0A2P6NL07_9EUKA|nr:hypothetical protein PROFUN_07901 [Planoprotostelium fungivorum]